MVRHFQAGMIVLTTVIMISIVMMLVLSLMQSVFLYTKASNSVLKKHKEFYQLEAAIQHLIAENHPNDCLFSEENPNKIVTWLLQMNGCRFTWNDHQYYYLIDDLGLYPCLQTYKGNSSHHWLYTIFSPVQQSILQLRIAKPAKALQCELLDVRNIKTGIISWRYLPSIFDKKSMYD